MIAADQPFEINTWRPIDTAPKSTSVPGGGGHIVTGIYVLGFIPANASSDRPELGISVVWWEPHGGPKKAGHWVADGDIGGCVPSHWLPLPFPPPQAERN